LVNQVLPNSGAEQAGLHATSDNENEGILWGDLVLAVDGVKIENLNDLLDILDKHAVGDTVKVLLYWQGKERTANVTLQSR